MKEKILQMVDAYWKFDEAQQPMSSWHDKQDLLKALEELLQPAVSKCGSIERETSCKHSDWIDLYYSSGDIYGRYCTDCGEFFE